MADPENNRNARRITIASERLKQLAGNENLAKLLALGAAAIALGVGHYAKQQLDRREFQRAIADEVKLRNALIKAGFRVVPAIDLEIEKWQQLARIEQAHIPNEILRSQVYRKISNEIGPQAYQDPEWYFVVENPQIDPQSPLGVIRYVFTDEILPEELEGLTHTMITARIERHHGKTMVVEAKAGNPDFIQTNPMLPKVIDSAGYLAVLDYTRRYSLSALRPETSLPLGNEELMERFRRRVTKTGYASPVWKELATVARFGHGFDPHVLTPDYWALTDTEDHTAVGWMVLRDPSRDPRPIDRGPQLLQL